VDRNLREGNEDLDAMTGRAGRDELMGTYVISVAARLLHMHPQTLRKYERIGLIMPSRTVGMLRLYSEQDIVRLRLIKHLVEELGLNLAGVQLTLGLFTRLLDVRGGLAQLEGNENLKAYLEKRLDEMFDLLDPNRA
jgi:MerR family transcriptional regulator/heat shock protein HspR